MAKNLRYTCYSKWTILELYIYTKLIQTESEISILFTVQNIWNYYIFQWKYNSW